MSAVDDDQIQVTFEVPTDDDGFLRRECPTCEQQFKWYAHAEGDPDAEVVEQYFCPLCGVPSGLDTWWTPEQLESAMGAAGPQIDQLVQDSLAQAFKGAKGLSYKPNPNATLGIPDAEPLSEANDMLIVESPCHPNEPVKVPENAAGSLHCLICGSLFAS
ncbi:hypothetical protein ABTZ46_10375 [Nocardioides sp. NPDC126508]